MDFNKLHTFLTIVEQGGVSRAAKTLYRTQSAISQSLKALEEQLKVKLIEWRGKQLILTREGQLIYEATSTRMEQIAEQVGAITSSQEAVGGCIDLGVLQDQSTPVQEILWQQISRFRKAYPAVTFRVHLMTSPQIEKSLTNYKIDIGFLINFEERYRFDVFELLSEEHLVVSSKKTLENQGPFEEIGQILKANLIDIDESYTCLGAWIGKSAPKFLTELQGTSPAIVIPDFHAIRQLVLDDQGIAVLPRYLIEDDLKRGTLIQVLPDLESLRVGVDAAVLRGGSKRLCDQKFLEELRLLAS